MKFLYGKFRIISLFSLFDNGLVCVLDLVFA